MLVTPTLAILIGIDIPNDFILIFKLNSNKKAYTIFRNTRKIFFILITNKLY